MRDRDTTLYAQTYDGRVLRIFSGLKSEKRALLSTLLRENPALLSP